VGEYAQNPACTAREKNGEAEVVGGGNDITRKEGTAGMRGQREVMEGKKKSEREGGRRKEGRTRSGGRKERIESEKDEVQRRADR